MCGIFCYYNQSLVRKTLSDNILQKAFMKIQHRGPDASVYIKPSENLHLGFHRLAINGLDNSKSGQPMGLNKTILICNGEIYNYKRLVNDYGFKMNSESDCEVILHMFDRFGLQHTIKELDGEYAFILHDEIKQRTYFVRDHLGIRPLFVGKTKNGEWIIASEAKAMTHLCEFVRPFLPGCYMDSRQMGKEIPYYDFHSMDFFGYNRHNFRSHSLSQIHENVNRILTKSVKERTISDRPIGAFLSGGLDSSLVVAILARERKNIPIFTIGLEGSPDIEAAKSVAKFLNLTDHHIVTYTIEEGIKAIPQVIKSLESYDITTIRASTPQWLLSKYIKEKTDVRVLLSGECIDEICGYFFLSFCETDHDFDMRTQKMLKQLYLYDLLRTDRTTAAHSLEVRVPFAQRELLQYLMNIDTKYKRFKNNELEKKIIRHAFTGYLPDDVLYRKKHAFSDSVSNEKTSWYGEISKYANKVISDEKFENRKKLYPINTPVDKESFYYREIFESFYPKRGNLIPNYWMPNVKDENGEWITDPSATVLKGFKKN